jgi:NADP-dependent 3-hydroxy acid dehydrogenase YdfG
MAWENTVLSEDHGNFEICVLTGRNQTTFEAAAKELGSGLVPIQEDTTDLAAIEKAVAPAVKKFGHLDIVFANAGIAAATLAGKTSLAIFEQLRRTNLTGVFFTIQSAAAQTEQEVPPWQL